MRRVLLPQVPAPGKEEEEKTEKEAKDTGCREVREGSRLP